MKRLLILFLVILMIVFMAMPCFSQVINEENAVEEIAAILTSIKAELTDLRVELQGIRVKLEERDKAYQNVALEQKEHSRELNCLRREISEIEGAWKNYLAVGGITGVLGLGFALFIKKYTKGVET